MSKFYGWLEVNENTPIEVKLVVLDNCVFTAILYGVETWGDISCIEKELINIETKALKAILKVKSGTTNDLIFHELRRSSIDKSEDKRQAACFLPEGHSSACWYSYCAEHNRDV